MVWGSCYICERHAVESADEIYCASVSDYTEFKVRLGRAIKHLVVLFFYPVRNPLVALPVQQSQNPLIRAGALEDNSSGYGNVLLGFQLPSVDCESSGNIPEVSNVQSWPCISAGKDSMKLAQVPILNLVTYLYVDWKRDRCRDSGAGFFCANAMHPAGGKFVASHHESCSMVRWVGLYPLGRMRASFFRHRLLAIGSGIVFQKACDTSARCDCQLDAHPQKRTTLFLPAYSVQRRPRTTA